VYIVTADIVSGSTVILPAATSAAATSATATSAAATSAAATSAVATSLITTSQTRPTATVSAVPTIPSAAGTFYGSQALGLAYLVFVFALIILW